MLCWCIVEQFNLQPDLGDFLNESSQDAKIRNYSLVQPVLHSMGIKLNPTTLEQLMAAKEGANANVDGFEGREAELGAYHMHRVEALSLLPPSHNNGLRRLVGLGSGLWPQVLLLASSTRSRSF